MSHVTDTPPPEIQEDLDGLDEALHGSLPERTLDDNLLLATWNLKAFGGLTEKWVADEDDSPKRDLHSIRVIAEILRRFDVIAIQEVYGDLKALRHTLKVLGSDWGLVLTDTTRGHRGRNERLAFLFDRRKIQMSGLAGELVIPDEWLDREEPLEPSALQRQFARTPYAVSFRCGGETFILVTLHVLYGDSVHERTPELRAIARWLDEWARDVNSWDHNLIALGDFNIDRHGDDRYEAFTSTGLHVPEDLHRVPRTISSDSAHPDREKFYDQIAWFTEDRDRPALSLTYRRGGHFDFRDVALPRRRLERDQLAWRISDHYPLWAEFEL
ncbi:endonuclease/exonuclease/phosphatase family protein [Natrinema gelatinilyticum]|uniref:endonuclease/exonuclease/phosphatase family protein n=1 Tax=Natrinema gelatinilyticum TaxID=2961571 RepID=UPI0020C466A5|nr:endonuclease/exonuclease/phosphatase family protein [Natrinema gelatinilyticum]